MSDIYRRLIKPKDLKRYDDLVAAGPSEELAILQATAASQWMTDPALADRIVAWAKPSGYVLEPSCGTGNLARACRAAGCDVTTVDFDPQFKPDVVGNYLELQFSGRFNFVVGNTPFEDDRDLEFAEKALVDADDVVLLVRINFLTGQERYRRLWKDVTLAGLVYLAARPSYKLVHRDVGGGRHDFCVVHFTLRSDVIPKPPEWWT